MVSVSGLKKLCLHGVISTRRYWEIRKMKRRNIYVKIPTFVKHKFELSKFTKDDCLLLFRFTQTEIRRLLAVFKLRTNYKIESTGTKFTGLEALCILLRRLSYPNRLSDLVNIFGRDRSALSRIYNWTCGYLFDNFSYLLTSLQQAWMNQTTFQNLADTCTRAGSYYQNIIGFIDGTGRPICRPKYQQRRQYSGYKKQHLIKYQSIVLPNGLIGRLDGPFNGHRHDSAILHLSNVLGDMHRYLRKQDGSHFAVFGDVGYSNQKFVKVGFKKHATLTASQLKFCRDMSALRVSVEYGFQKIVTQFAYVDFKKNQQMYLTNLGRQFFVAALLVNCQCCLRGNQVSDYFEINPPSLEEYVNGV